MAKNQEADIYNTVSRFVNTNANVQPDRLQEKQADWDRDGEIVRHLYKTTWKRHPITLKPYFDWRFLQKPNGKGIGYCAIPVDKPGLCAGIYAVIPTKILLGSQKLDFGTSLHTMTHPQYYRRGIFARLAKDTYEECARRGILGTIGIPNNNSLPGFTKELEFKTIGRFSLVARHARLASLANKSERIKKVSSEDDLSNFVFDLDLIKAKSGIILAERSRDFIAWRFLRCPGAKYHILTAVDDSGSVRGMAVMRSTKKRRVPITVLVDFLVDQTFPEADSIASDLLSEADRLAWRHLSPVVVTLVNPSSYEAKLLSHRGFKKLPGVILPHDSNFIIKLHRDLPDELKQRIHKFENWHFSFADYDIF